MKAVEISGKDIYDWATAKVEKLRLPVPTKPSFPSPEFELPDDPNRLTSTELGQLMLRMTAFYGYCLRMLGMVESELCVVEAEYKIKVHTASLEVRKEMEGRPAVDVVEAAVLAQNEDLTPLYKRRLELMAIRQQLDARLKIYEKCGSTLSRELSRREVETRIT